MDPNDTKRVSKAIIVDNNNRILILKPKDREKWHLPGGHLQYKESFLFGMKREVREETNLQVTFFSIIDSRDKFQLFLCKTSTTMVKLSKEHSDSAWVDILQAAKKYHLTKETFHDINTAIKKMNNYKQVFKIAKPAAPKKKPIELDEFGEPVEDPVE